MAQLFLDHNVAARIADLLEARGHTATTAKALGLEEARDNQFLLRAAHDQRILVTHNWKDFLLLHNAWQEWSVAWGVSSKHAGILVVPMPPRWNSQRAADEIDTFLTERASAVPVANTLHRWTPDRDWVPY